MQSDKRDCGTCSVCCKVYAIRDLEKEPGIWCQHCVPGIGCQRYAHRPRTCKHYECAWLKGAGVPSERPDLSGIVYRNHISNLYGASIRVMEFRPGALESQAARTVIRRAVSADLFVEMFSTTLAVTIVLSRRFAQMGLDDAKHAIGIADAEVMVYLPEAYLSLTEMIAAS